MFSVVSFHFPSGTATKQVVNTLNLGLGLDLLHLVTYTVVVGDILDITDNSQCYREIRAFHIHQGHLKADVVGVGIVDEYVVEGEASLTHVHYAQLVAVENEALLLVFAEEHLLAVAQDYGCVRAQSRVAELLVGTVVKDDAVGEHLHHGAAVVERSCGHNLLIESQFHIQTAGKEGTLGA